MMDRYQLMEQLGEGGAGSVYKAWDTKLQRYVAVKKLLPPEQRLAAGAGDNLAMEAAALSALQHPNIVSVYDLDTDGPEQFVVMEFINGETLEATVRRGALLAEDFQRIAEESLDGLNAAHRQGMCHRDLKPSNLMFHWLPDGRWQTKLLDFGLANFGVRPAQQELTGEGTVAGSVHFMAPEQFLRQPMDTRTDIYSLGCVLYYALTGSFPCNGATVQEVMNAHLARQVTPLRSLRADIAPLLTDWVMWLMSRQPEERPESATEALRVLRGILSGELASLPGQRVLKTQPVPRTAVIAAPLSRDVAARAKVTDETGAAIPLSPTAAPRPPGTNGPAGVYRPPSLVKPGGAASKAAGSGSRTVSKKMGTPATPQRARPAKSQTPLVIGIIATLAAAGAATAFFISKNSPSKAGPGDDAEGQVSVPAGPPQEHLLIWYDASKGARTKAGSVAAATGDRVDQWNDSAPLAGNNAAQYHASGSPSADKERRRPTLLRVTGTDGLHGTHDVMQFDGANCLVFGRDRDKVGDAVGKELGGNRITVIAVFSAAAGSRTQGLFSARSGRETRAWDAFARDGKIYAGVRKPGGAENHTSLPLQPSSGFHVLAIVWDGSHDRLRLWLTAPDGTTAESTAINGTTDFGDVPEVRLGALNATTSPLADFLKGGIASLLVYNHALDDAAREAAVDYLCRRYFGVPVAKP